MARPTLKSLPAAAVILLLLAPPATAQTSRPDRSEPPVRTTDDTNATDSSETPDGLLAGPRVEESRRASDRTGFGTAGRDRSPIRLNIRQWLSTLRDLDLGTAQADEIRGIVTEMDTARKAFQRAYGEELTSLQGLVREARRERRPPDDSTLERLEEIRSLAPDIEAYQTRIWNLLTSSQQDQMSSRLRDRRAELEARRARDRPMDAMMDSERPATTRPAAPSDDGPSVSERRLRFLRAHRSRRAPGTEIPPERRVFDFEEDDD